MVTKLTKSTVQAAARKAFGPNATLRENTKALSPEEKQRVIAVQKERVERKKQLEAEKQTFGDTHAALVKAARFALDVDGDEPSWEQLRIAVEAAERLATVKEEYAALMEAIRWNSGLLCGHRYEVAVVERMGPLGLCNVVKAQGDTLEELMAKIESRAP